jgi:hypothetical protein
MAWGGAGFFGRRREVPGVAGEGGARGRLGGGNGRRGHGGLPSAILFGWNRWSGWAVGAC